MLPYTIKERPVPFGVSSVTKVISSFLKLLVVMYSSGRPQGDILISSQVHDRAGKIGEYVAEKGYFDDRGITKNGGKVIFENMDTGLYLVTRTYTENTEYIVDPFLVSIPQVVDGEVIYRVVVEPKFSEVPDEESSGVDKPSEPESSEPSEQQDSGAFFTGDNRSWQSLIYILIGAFAVITGILLSDGKLKGNKE